MTDYIQLPLQAAKHDLGTVFDASGETFCVSYGMEDEVAAKAMRIVLGVNMHETLVALCAEAYALLDVLYVEGMNGHEKWIERLREDIDGTLKPLLSNVAPPSSLADVKEGDLVARWTYAAPRGLAKFVRVDRTTRTQIIIGNDRFSRETGQMLGGWFTSDKIKPVSQEAIGGMPIVAEEA